MLHLSTIPQLLLSEMEKRKLELLLSCLNRERVPCPALICQHLRTGVFHPSKLLQRQKRTVAVSCCSQVSRRFGKKIRTEHFGFGKRREALFWNYLALFSRALIAEECHLWSLGKGSVPKQSCSVVADWLAAPCWSSSANN